TPPAAPVTTTVSRLPGSRPRGISGALQIDQREAGFGVLALAQMRRRLDQRQFERRPDMAFEEMAADRAAVPPAEDGVQMQGRPLVRDRDIAEQRQHLDLFRDRDAFVV